MNSLHTPLYSPGQIRAIERQAIDQQGIPSLDLMHKAGRAVFAEIAERWPKLNRILILAGAGNNAGDGYVIAKLALQAGYQTFVLSLTDPQQLAGDALSCFQEYQQSGGDVCLGDFESINSVDLIVDALFGIGLNRALSDRHQTLIAWANQAAAIRVAVDIPSGLDANTGAVLGEQAFLADLTVTFIAGKPGLYTGAAVNYTGEIVIADLDLPADSLDVVTAEHFLLAKLPLSPRPKNVHKTHFGHVLLVGGNQGYVGAIILAAEAALRSGAGLVSVATRASHSHLLSMVRPEIMSHEVEDAEQFRPLLEKATVIVVGPGLGQDQWAQCLLQQILMSDKACVWDADALNWLAVNPRRFNNCIFTPHPGEASRLLNCRTTDIAKDRFAAVQALQSKYGGIWVLKGAGSLISDGHQVWVSITGNPGMASGGMGDVLAGLSGGLLAQGLSELQACQLAVYVHGEAADISAAKDGERGMLASDVIAHLRLCLNNNSSDLQS